MIAHDKREPGFRALHSLLIYARHEVALLAEEDGQGVAYRILDYAEYMMLMFLGPEEKTKLFRDNLQDLISWYPEAGGALDFFDNSEQP
ncbi:MAG: hypothetical protein IPK83_20745 [Planctomycetes bacterium]|nr:hypothetical protein [Planctomycetota bacterium]